MVTRSFRSRLRAFQRMHADSVDPGFIADLEFLENRDLDLSIRLGAMLAFNALLITIGTHPVSASPGAPLSVDAATQPLMMIASLIGVAPFGLSSGLVLYALMIGEEFEVEGQEHDDDALRRRLLAAFIRSIDAQSLLLRRAVQATIGGGLLTLAAWGWILAAKIAG